MMRILHLFDASAGWEQRIAVRQLLECLPGSDYPQLLATIDRAARDRPGWNAFAMTLLKRRLGLPALAGAAIRAFVEREDVDLIHAWGSYAGAAARAACPDGKPLVVTVFDPGIADRAVRIIRTIGTPRGFAVVCAAQRVERRLVERGVAKSQCVVIRPGVDFAAAAAARRKPFRAELALPDRGTIVLSPELPADLEGQRSAVWSVLMRSYLEPEVRIIVPGVAEELPDLRRLAQASESPHIAVFTEDRYPFEELCAFADYFVLGTIKETSLTAIAWAMASATPIIAPATYATAEVLAADSNAILFKASALWRRRAAQICALYDRTEKLPAIKELARGQAYELFSRQRTIEQHRRLYDNLAGGADPGTGISDVAVLDG